MDSLVNVQIETSVKQQESKWTDGVTKKVDSELKTRATAMQEMQKVLADAKEQTIEIQDKENRRNNIIIYRMEESDGTSADERNRADVRFCVKLLC